MSETVLRIDGLRHAYGGVPVLDGHMLSVSVSLERAASRDELLAAWEEFRGEPRQCVPFIWTRRLATKGSRSSSTTRHEDGRELPVTHIRGQPQHNHGHGGSPPEEHGGDDATVDAVVPLRGRRGQRLLLGIFFGKRR